MNLPIPKIIDATLSSALAAGCDCVMPKLDGWPILVNCIGDGCNILSALPAPGESRPGGILSYKDVSTLERLDESVLREPLSALFVGARSRFTPVIHIFDMWWFDNQDIQMHSYRERYALARSNVRKLDERFKMITVSPIQAATSLWSDIARDTETFKGLVCRRSKDSAAGELYVIRYYPEEPRALE